jgi:hypothetical protein
MQLISCHHSRFNTPSAACTRFDGSIALTRTALLVFATRVLLRDQQWEDVQRGIAAFAGYIGEVAASCLIAAGQHKHRAFVKLIPDPRQKRPASGLSCGQVENYLSIPSKRTDRLPLKWCNETQQ